LSFRPAAAEAVPLQRNAGFARAKPATAEWTCPRTVFRNTGIAVDKVLFFPVMSYAGGLPLTQGIMTIYVADAI